MYISIGLRTTIDSYIPSIFVSIASHTLHSIDEDFDMYDDDSSYM